MNNYEKKFKSFLKEGIEEERDPSSFYVLYQKKGEFSKPAAAEYKDKEDAEKFADSLESDGYSAMVLDQQSMDSVKGVDLKEEINEEEFMGSYDPRDPNIQRIVRDDLEKMEERLEAMVELGPNYAAFQNAQYSAGAIKKALKLIRSAR